MTEEFFLPLTVVAAVSPLLTFAALWQVKEWRYDRLREHLRAEGWLRQLFGVIRPMVLLVYLIIAPITHEQFSIFNFQFSIAATLLLLTALTVLQFILRRQPMPVWTQKASSFVLLSFIGIILTAYQLRTSPLLPLVVLLPPFFVLGSCLLLCPLDRLLKSRVMQRARTVRSQYPDLTVIGVTGSVGKTTTKELLAHVLGDRKTLVTPAHVNTEMGVSQWLTRHLSNDDPEPEILIVEMGAYRKGEIRTLCEIAQPTMGVITFIGTQHIALFGSQQDLCDAKAELIESLPEHGQAFLNADSKLCAGIRGRAPCPVTTVGTGGHADVEAFDIEETTEGIRFRVDDTVFTLGLHGSHNVSNVLLTIAVAEKLGMSRGEIALKLHSFEPLRHTFEMREERDVTVLDDTHNASPESFRAAIAWARTQPMEHKVLLTSGLIELGESQDRIHAELGAMASEVFDDVICLNKKSAATFARGYGKPVTLFGKHQAVPAGSLLVCEGRMSTNAIHALLP